MLTDGEVNTSPGIQEGTVAHIKDGGMRVGDGCLTSDVSVPRPVVIVR